MGRKLGAWRQRVIFSLVRPSLGRMARSGAAAYTSVFFTWTTALPVIFFRILGYEKNKYLLHRGKHPQCKRIIIRTQVAENIRQRGKKKTLGAVQQICRRRYTTRSPSLTFVLGGEIGSKGPPQGNREISAVAATATHSSMLSKPPRLPPLLSPCISLSRYGKITSPGHENGGFRVHPRCLPSSLDHRAYLV